LAPVLFRVPALFGVFRRDEGRSLSCCSPLHLLCCLRAAHALAAARALGPLLWDRPRRAARCASGSSSCCTAHWVSPHDCHCFPQQANLPPRLESSPPSEIQSSWISGNVSVPALRVNGGRALRLGTGERAVSTHSHLPERVRPDAL